MSCSEDILHVRLQTIGVTEHAFDINLGGVNYNWLLYDVGGAVRIHFLGLYVLHASHPRRAVIGRQARSRPLFGRYFLRWKQTGT